MGRSVIIGDIHGCSDALQRLLDALPDDIEQIYSVGDLVDRGPDSKGVVQLCMDNNIKAVRGNHEDMFLDFLKGTKEYDEGHFESGASGGDKTIASYQEGLFEMNGGDKTIRSYGGESYEVPDMYGSYTISSNCQVPDDHMEYLLSMPIFIETDDFILSHAGIHPLRASTDFGLEKWDSGAEKSETDLMWNRSALAVMDKIQIVGHTPDHEVQYVKRLDELAAINIDTACGKLESAKLTAILMPNREIIQVICTEI